MERLKEGYHDRLVQQATNEFTSLKSVLEIENGPGILHQSLRETAAQRMEALSNWKQLQDWLWHGGGLVGAEVPAEGNCSIWSLLSLFHDDPFLVVDNLKDECQSLRLKIANCWPQVSEDKIWQELFVRLLNDIPIQSAKVKTEPAAPKRKGKKQKTVFVDLTTPPRDSKKSSKTAEVVGSQRPALKVKGTDASPFETPPIQRCAEEAAKKLEAKQSKKAGKEEAQKPSKKRSTSKEATEKPSKKRSTSKEATEKKAGGAQNLKERLEAIPELESEPKKPKKKNKKLKKIQQPDEEDAETKQERRKRSCKTKVWTPHNWKIEAAQTYLASKDVTWSDAQHFHAQAAPDGSSKCRTFKSLPEMLLKGEMPECQQCLAVLQERNVVIEDLRAYCEAQEESGVLAGKKRWMELEKELGADVSAKPMDEETLIIFYDAEFCFTMLYILWMVHWNVVVPGKWEYFIL